MCHRAAKPGVPQLLSLCSRAGERQQLRPRAEGLKPMPLSPCSMTREAPTVRSPHTTAREQPLLTTTAEKPM